MCHPHSRFLNWLCKHSGSFLYWCFLYPVMLQGYALSLTLLCVFPSVVSFLDVVCHFMKSFWIPESIWSLLLWDWRTDSSYVGFPLSDFYHPWLPYLSSLILFSTELTSISCFLLFKLYFLWPLLGFYKMSLLFCNFQYDLHFWDSVL